LEIKTFSALFRAKSDRKATRPRPTRALSPNESDKDFETNMFFYKIVQRSDSKISNVATTQGAQGQALQVIPWGYIWFLWRGCSYKLQGGLI